MQAVRPDGEVAVARAAAARGTVMNLNSFANKPIEKVVAANPHGLPDLLRRGREQMLQHIARARAGGPSG
jgi:isopentenyl diphosphate isomerase/L-lactate dehydrogenase-like FMN-dependent dehydrogenase